MLTRLRVTGFKNLLGADICFGPFTCIAGGNGVGKSNVFDAIHFLHALSYMELVEAAQSIRDEKGRSGDIRELFYRHGDEYASSMRFEVEMIVPKEALDHLRQKAIASSTLLRYVVELKYRGEDSPFGPLEIVLEELSYFKKSEAPRRLLFPHSARTWRDELIVANRYTAKPFIGTATSDKGRIIEIRQDGTAGRPQPRLAEPLPRTVLSSLSAAESPTAVAARSEMLSWKHLQFEPSALRQSDDLRAPAAVAADGRHMAATLHRLVSQAEESDGDGVAVRQRIANRLSELVDDIADVRVERDDKRELLTIFARLRDGTEHPARSLSDGTLRFLALAIIQQTTANGGLFCLEEPENGIHPERVPAMLELLQEIAVDPNERSGPDNPLRQVIINTHSPVVVSEVDDDSLVVAGPMRVDGTDYGFSGVVNTVSFSSLPSTWRTENMVSDPVLRGRLLAYLQPFAPTEESTELFVKRKRVMDRPDLRQYFLQFGPEA